MEIDFEQAFSDHPNVALLQVLASPEHYQPGAVAAAQAILATRSVTEEERAQAYALPAAAQLPIPESASIFEAVPPALPDKRFQSMQWSIIGLLGIQYLSPLYKVLAWLYLTIRHGFWPSDLLRVIPATIASGIIGISLYLLATAKKPGWILSYGIGLYRLAVYCSLLMDAMAGTSDKMAPMYLLLTGLNACILYYLMKPEFFAHYISRELFVKLRLWGIAGFALYLAAAYLQTFVLTPGASF